MHKIVRNAVVKLLFLIQATALPVLAQERVTIAVVKDGPSSEDRLAALIEDELKLIIKADADISFKTDPTFDAQGDISRDKRAFSSE